MGRWDGAASLGAGAALVPLGARSGGEPWGPPRSRLEVGRRSFGKFSLLFGKNLGKFCLPPVPGQQLGWDGGAFGMGELLGRGSFWKRFGAHKGAIHRGGGSPSLPAPNAGFNSTLKPGSPRFCEKKTISTSHPCTFFKINDPRGLRQPRCVPAPATTAPVYPLQEHHGLGLHHQNPLPVGITELSLWGRCPENPKPEAGLLGGSPGTG